MVVIKNYKSTIVKIFTKPSIVIFYTFVCMITINKY